MLTGIVIQAHPTNEQKRTISQWMGCARFIWNAKCDEDFYLTKFAKRYLPVGTYPKIDQTYCQYKNEDLSPWLSDCPSQILRNSASNWYKTYQNFLKGICGKPKRKKKCQEESIHLTRELFCFEECSDGVTRLFIGTKTNNIGFLSIKNHSSYKEPKSIRIKKKNGRYSVSFCYEDEKEDFLNQSDHLKYLKTLNREQLEKMTIGIDRGIKRPVQSGDETYDFSPEQKKKKQAKERYIKRCQKSISKKKKGSRRRAKKKLKLSKAYEKISNIRKDFCHKTSRSIVNKEESKVIILEDLRTKQMTKKPKAKKDEATGKWAKNNKKSKAGLNRSILDKGWHQMELFLQYKACRAGKALFKVPAHHTSQECADCSHTHPDNRKTQELFFCVSCGHSDNADKNATKVIKKRAIDLILNSGTELSNRGVLLDKGCGAANKTRGANANRAGSKEASKKNVLATTKVA
jgi:putative transposase